MKGRRLFWLSAILLVFPLVATTTALAIEVETLNMVERGRFEMSDERYEDALKFFEQALAREPGCISCAVGLGEALMKLGRTDEAKARFDKLIQQGGEAQIAGYLALGNLSAADKEYNTAADYYTKAIASAPDRAEIYLTRGRMYLEASQWDQAEADFKAAAAKDPKLAVRAQYNLAFVSYRKQDYGQAQDRIKEAEGLGPDMAMADRLTRLSALVASEERANRWWLVSGTAGIEFDDNLPTNPLYGAVDQNTNFTDTQDYRFLFSGRATMFFQQRRTNTLGLEYVFRGQFYQFNPGSDLVTNSLGLFYNYSNKPWYARMRGDLYWFFSGHHDTLLMPTLSFDAARVWNDRNRTEFSAILSFKRYRDDRLGQDDGLKYVYSLWHYFTILNPTTQYPTGLVARGGVKYEIEAPYGNRSVAYDMTEFLAGITFPLPAGFYGDLEYGYGKLKYATNPAWGNTDRMDTRQTFTARFGRPLNQYMKMDFAWYYTSNDSDLFTGNAGRDQYEYIRNVYSLTLTATY